MNSGGYHGDTTPSPRNDQCHQIKLSRIGRVGRRIVNSTVCVLCSPWCRIGCKYRQSPQSSSKLPSSRTGRRRRVQNQLRPQRRAADGLAVLHCNAGGIHFKGDFVAGLLAHPAVFPVVQMPQLFLRVCPEALQLGGEFPDGQPPGVS